MLIQISQFLDRKLFTHPKILKTNIISIKVPGHGYLKPFAWYDFC